MPTEFQKIYNRLNTAQKQAVDTIDGPVMVVAGPGTGKTQVLSVRIANILQKTDTPPDAILALTFTESAAKNMRERLTSIIGPTAYYVNISTFHSFCTDIIRNNPDQFFLSLEAEPLADLEKIEIIQSIIDIQHFDKLKPTNTPYYYVREILRRIQELKREGITAKQFETILHTTKSLLEKEKATLPKSEYATQLKNLTKNQELLVVFKSYQEEILKRNRFDFEDMINFVVDKFRNDEEFLRQQQERFHYFLVDEYQDTNSAQNETLYLLANFWGQEANIFVVGDPNQSIYRFQGASLENIIGFQKRFPQATTVTLTDNYRSNQRILDSSFALIDNNKEDTTTFKTTKLTSKKDLKEKKISVLALPSETVEEFFVIDTIKNLLKEGVPPEEIAVLYRNNNDSIILSDTLSKEGILYNIEGGIDILHDPGINQLLNFFNLIEKSKYQTDDLDLFTVLHYEFLQFDSLDILKLSRLAAESKKHMLEVITDTDFKKKNKYEIENPDAFIEFLKKITTWQELDANSTFVHFFEQVLKESGYLSWVLNQQDKIERLNRINSLYAEIKSLNKANHNLKLSTFLEDLELMRQNNLNITEDDLDLTKGAITLSTVHKAKGKEWQYVFIIKTINGKWGNKKSRELIKLPEQILENTDLTKKEVNEEERRLFYVALTRAKEKVYILYAETTSSNGRKRENTPSLFITELPKEHIETMIPTTFESETILTKLLSPETKNISQVQTEKEQEFLARLVDKFKLSPTALNTYLECPYKFKLNTLIKVPRAKAVYLSFGTAIHRGLELFYQKYKNEGALPPLSYITQEFEKALAKEVLTDEERSRYLQKGKETLETYYNYYKESFTPALFTEKFFGYGYSKTYLNDIPLTGKIDRIDLVDRDEKTVKVVDYKTGKPKSRNFIEGKTEGSDGGYKRQLVFYKLLSQLDHNFPLEVISAELDFVEATETGKLKKESFAITIEEVDELKTTIHEVMEKIRALAFEKTIDTKPCQFCEFKDHCWPEGELK